MANASQAFLSTFNAALGGGVSADLTFSFAITQEFQAFLPIRIDVSCNMSYAAEVWVYQSGDGGNSWETEGSLASIFSRTSSGAGDYDMRQGIELETGQYLIRVVTGGGTAATYSCELQTAQLISAYV